LLSSPIADVVVCDFSGSRALGPAWALSALRAPRHTSGPGKTISASPPVGFSHRALVQQGVDRDTARGASAAARSVWRASGKVSTLLRTASTAGAHDALRRWSTLHRQQDGFLSLPAGKNFCSVAFHQPRLNCSPVLLCWLQLRLKRATWGSAGCFSVLARCWTAKDSALRAVVERNGSARVRAASY
jgi:hypothetical protein